MKNKTPFVDLKCNYFSIKREIDEAIQDVINKTAFIGGTSNPFVNQFEKDFQTYLGIEHVISCANGTDAIEIALQALGIGMGDEVLVPALTWISTAEAVVNIGAEPVFVDINTTDNGIDADLLAEKITNKTKAIIAVHLYGTPANVGAIDRICKAHNLFFIEDCAQAHGALYHNKKVGTFGDIATFSFYPGKNLGAFGDAGAIVCQNNEIAAIAKQIANHGQDVKHNHLRIGRNSRMDGIQAAILSVKLKYIDRWNADRIDNANYYNELISDAYQKPIFEKHLKSVFHLYVIKTANRAQVLQVLADNNIASGIHYPKALSEMDIFTNKTSCPVANSTCESIISLPIYPELDKATITDIAAVLNNINK
jgi:dTDP-4-amino-4,6-dideoxygalactose transaminase